MFNSHLQNLVYKNKASSELCHVSQVPKAYHEHFILSGYRKPHVTISQCIRSVIEWNNEVFNIWTHLLSALAFTIYLATELQTLSDYTLPYIVLISGSIIYTTTSTFAHTFNVLSVEIRHCCFMLDYAALSFYSMMTALTIRAYGFPYGLKHTWFYQYYIPLAGLAAIYCTLFACRSRFFRLKSEVAFQLVRLSSFIVPFIVVHYPLFYRLAYGIPEHLETDFNTVFRYKSMLFFAGFSSFLYSSHIPERFWPGKFDVLGHSHSLFHCTTAIGTYVQLLAVRADLQFREQYLVEHDSWSVYDCWYLIVPTIINLLIVSVYGLSCLRKRKIKSVIFNNNEPSCDQKCN